MNLYVYFKFVPNDANLILHKIIQMQEDLAHQFPGLNCDVLKRPEKDADGKETWMEVYALNGVDGNAFKERLKELANSNQLPQPRFSEAFIPLK